MLQHGQVGHFEHQADVPLARAALESVVFALALANRLWYSPAVLQTEAYVDVKSESYLVHLQEGT